jgi:hypothetical protein
MRALVSSAGSATSASYRLRAQVGAAALASGIGSASASFRLSGGAASVDPAFPSGTPPLVFGTRYGGHDWSGGPLDRVYGFNLNPTSGVTNMTYDGVLGSPSTVVSNTMVDVLVPAGVDQLGNPPAHVAVGASNELGSTDRESAFVYRPALWQATVARKGYPMALGLESELGAFYQAWLGGVFPGFGLPLSGWDGSVVVLDGPVAFTGLLPTLGGRAEIPLFLPNDPTLSGATFWVQAFVLTNVAPLEGGFTRAVPVTILP